MELQDLGFTDWFTQKREELGETDGETARIAAVDRESYLVRNASGEAQAEISGKLRFAAESSLDLPATGDWVLAQFYNDNTFAIIDQVLPRRSILKRKTAGKKSDYQVIAANIDTAMIIQSCDTNFNLRRLERYLVMAIDGNIEPMVILSKSDLISQNEIEDRINAVKTVSKDCRVLAMSSQSGKGLAEVRQALKPAHTYCLLGSSGVGKTTLLNLLAGQEAFAVKEVRKDGKGRHTTTRRQLVTLPGGAMIIDTPGMRELGSTSTGEGIDRGFIEIAELSNQCRFKDCSHTSETDCAVLAAIEDGTLSRARYSNYLKLLKESEHNEMSYEQKRKKDKKLGQFYKTAKKTSREFKKK